MNLEDKQIVIFSLCFIIIVIFGTIFLFLTN